MTQLDRTGFLRLGTSGLVAAAAVAVVPAPANAQLPAPAPIEDDLAFMSFATVAERASRDFYRAAIKQAKTGLTAAQRRHTNRVASSKREHILRPNVALGAGAPLSSDFVTLLPKGAVRTKARILALGAQLEALLVRVYLNGVGLTQDAARGCSLSACWRTTRSNWRGCAGLPVTRRRAGCSARSISRPPRPGSMPSCRPPTSRTDAGGAI